MDHEDRLAYIKKVKKNLGLDGGILLKSSKRVVMDGQLRKDMPCLEFSGMFRNLHQHHIFEPFEMKWSTHEFNKESNIEWMEKEQDERLIKQFEKEKDLLER